MHNMSAGKKRKVGNKSRHTYYIFLKLKERERIENTELYRGKKAEKNERHTHRVGKTST